MLPSSRPRTQCVMIIMEESAEDFKMSDTVCVFDRSHVDPKHWDQEETVIYDNSCNLHTYCLNRDPLLFKHTWFLMDRLHWKNHKADMLEDDSVHTYDPSADLFARSHDDSSMEGVTESSTVGCPVADADMAEDSKQSTAMDLRTVIHETQVHGQPSTSSAINQEHSTIRLRATMVDEWLNNEDEYNTYVPDINLQDEAPRFLLRDQFDGASVICYCSKCGSKYVSERTKLRSEEAAPGSRGEASHFLEDENDERNGPEHGLTLSEDVPQYVSDIRETAML
ncbi:hypothetical protein Bbelb_051130 [Branchiostoma belcheri]|nr:hypothetical protein Bbelb_051130 [Branchiostoma belcheri]